MEVNMKKISKKKIGLYGLAVFCIVIVGIIVTMVLTQEKLAIDTQVYNWISTWQSTTMTNLVKNITRLGSTTVLMTIAAISLLGKDRKLGIVISLNLFVITMLNKLLKGIIQRPRPDERLRLIEEHGFSFPSRTFNGKYGILWTFYLFYI